MRIDYTNYRFCEGCHIRFSKIFIRCPNCHGRKVRSNARNTNRITEVKRY